jgi:hypothetical protein
MLPIWMVVNKSAIVDVFSFRKERKSFTEISDEQVFVLLTSTVYLV